MTRERIPSLLRLASSFGRGNVRKFKNMITFRLLKVFLGLALAFGKKASIAALVSHRRGATIEITSGFVPYKMQFTCVPRG
jgi:hypothetical protein